MPGRAMGSRGDSVPPEGWSPPGEKRGQIPEMADHEEPSARGLFGGVFARGGADTSDVAWLQAMLDAEAGLARALERAGLTPAGSGAAVTEVAQGDRKSVV